MWTERTNNWRGASLTIALRSRGGQWTSFRWPRVVLLSLSCGTKKMRGFSTISRNIEIQFSLAKRRVEYDFIDRSSEKMELVKNLFLFFFFSFFFRECIFENRKIFLSKITIRVFYLRKKTNIDLLETKIM